jgi:hypothetical protein
VQGKVIEFWRAVEMFSPPAIPSIRPSQWVFNVEPDELLPWNAGHPLRQTVRVAAIRHRGIAYLGDPR